MEIDVGFPDFKDNGQNWNTNRKTFAYFYLKQPVRDFYLGCQRH